MFPLNARLYAKLILAFIAACVAVFFVAALQSPPVQAQSSGSAREVYDVLAGAKIVTCANNVVDGGVFPAACTQPFTVGSTYLSCADVDGCTMTFSEAGAVSGREIHIVNTSANAATFAESSGVWEGAGTFVMGQWDMLTVVYVNDRYVEVARSNN